MAELSQLSVQDYMTTNLLTFTPDTDIMSAIGTLVKHRHSGAPVVGPNGELVGVLSEKDCLKIAVAASYEGVSPGRVGDFMSPSAVAIKPDDTLLDAATRFLDSPFKRLPVVQGAGRTLVGQLSRSDVLRAIHEHS